MQTCEADFAMKVNRAGETARMISSLRWVSGIGLRKPRPVKQGRPQSCYATRATDESRYLAALDLDPNRENNPMQSRRGSGRTPEIQPAGNAASLGLVRKMALTLLSFTLSCSSAQNMLLPPCGSRCRDRLRRPVCRLRSAPDKMFGCRGCAAKRRAGLGPDHRSPHRVA